MKYSPVRDVGSQAAAAAHWRLLVEVKDRASLAQLGLQPMPTYLEQMLSGVRIAYVPSMVPLLTGACRRHANERSDSLFEPLDLGLQHAAVPEAGVQMRVKLVRVRPELLAVGLARLGALLVQRGDPFV